LICPKCGSWLNEGNHPKDGFKLYLCTNKACGYDEPQCFGIFNAEQTCLCCDREEDCLKACKEGSIRKSILRQREEALKNSTPSNTFYLKDIVLLAFFLTTLVSVCSLGVFNAFLIGVVVAFSMAAGYLFHGFIKSKEE